MFDNSYNMYNNIVIISFIMHGINKNDNTSKTSAVETNSCHF